MRALVAALVVSAFLPTHTSAGYGGVGGLRLQLKPRPVSAGERVGIVVINDTDRQAFYGLALRVERREGDRWVAAEKAIYGTRKPVFRRIGLGVRPRERAGPGHRTVRDEIALPKTLAAGLYRVSKEIRTGRKTVTISSAFRI